MRKIVALIILMVVLTIPTQGKTVAKRTVNGYTLSVTYEKGKTMIKWNGKTYYTYRGKFAVRFVKEKNLTAKMLMRRKGKIIYIEILSGRVTNRKLDGKTINGGYISYRKLGRKVKKGDRVITFCVYNPNTYWIDDIADRFDIPVR